MRKKLCILEDDKDIREIIEFLFVSEDYEVWCFSTIKELMSRKNEVIPDLFLLDVMLPDGNGIDVCNELNSLESTATVPVLMMSANTEANKISMACNAKGFISKPFDLDHMLHTVHQAISLHNS